MRWVIIALWIIVAVGSIPLASSLSGVLGHRGDPVGGGQSQKADMLLTSRLHQPVTQILAVLQSSSTSVSDPAYQREVREVLARAKGLAHVTSVMQAGIGKDGYSDLIVIGFDQDTDTVSQELPALRTQLSSGLPGPAHVSLVGDRAIANEALLDTQSSLTLVEIMVILLIGLAMLMVLGGIVASLLSLILAGMAVVVALALLSLLAVYLEISTMVGSVVSFLGLGLSIDFSLVMIRRFREELEQDGAVPLAIAQAIATAGEALFWSALIVIIGFVGLLFLGTQIMTSFGIGGITIASTTMLATMTFLPAMLSVVGTRLRLCSASQRAPTLWHGWAKLMMKQPIFALIFVTLLFIGLGWPALSLIPEHTDASAPPAGSETRHGLDVFTAPWPSIREVPILVVVQTPDGSSVLTRPNLHRLASLTTWIAGLSHVTDVASLTRFSFVPGAPREDEQQLAHLYSTGAYQQIPELHQFVAHLTADNTTLVMVQPDTTAGSRDDEVLIDQLRSPAPQVKQGLTILVGGTRATRLDENRALSRNIPRALVFLLLSTCFVLFLTFRSLLLSLQVIVMNILSISGACGTLIFVLEQGHGEQLLGGPSSGISDHFIPLLLFCTLFGLSMDDKVFLLSRIRDAWLCTHDHRTAVMVGLEKTDGGMATMALLVAMGLGTCLFTHVMVIQQWGLGILMAALMDATVTRLVLVPATMELVSRWNWWQPAGSRHDSLLMARKPERHLPAFLSWLLSACRGDAHVKDHFLAQQRAVEQTLIQIVAQVLERAHEQVQATSDFFDEGGDSRSLVALLGAIEQRWQMPIEANDVFDHPVLLHLASLITERSQQIQVRVSVSHPSGEGLLHENRRKKRNGGRSCLTLCCLSLR